jgi:hypothetical protein
MPDRAGRSGQRHASVFRGRNASEPIDMSRRCRDLDTLADDLALLVGRQKGNIGGVSVPSIGASRVGSMSHQPFSR